MLNFAWFPLIAQVHSEAMHIGRNLIDEGLKCGFRILDLDKSADAARHGSSRVDHATQKLAAFPRTIVACVVSKAEENY